MRNSNLINQELGMFSYKDPELWTDENIYDETQAPWFYHINNRNKESKRNIIYIYIIEHINMQLSPIYVNMGVYICIYSCTLACYIFMHI